MTHTNHSSMVRIIPPCIPGTDHDHSFDLSREIKKCFKTTFYVFRESVQDNFNQVFVAANNDISYWINRMKPRLHIRGMFFYLSEAEQLHRLAKPLTCVQNPLKIWETRSQKSISKEEPVIKINSAALNFCKWIYLFLTNKRLIDFKLAIDSYIDGFLTLGFNKIKLIRTIFFLLRVLRQTNV